jgi:hypothetical protein
MPNLMALLFCGVSLLCRLPAGFGRWVPVDIDGEFDSGSGRTLAACLTHASRTVMASLLV